MTRWTIITALFICGCGSFPWKNYAFVLQSNNFGVGVINSILRTVLGAVIHCAVAGAAACGLSLYLLQLHFVYVLLRFHPPSPEESARIDGAGMGTIFLRIIFPVSKPIFATVALYQIVGHW